MKSIKVLGICGSPRVILNLPENLSLEMMICIGYAAPPGKSQLPMRPKKKVTWQSLTDWERYEHE